MLIPILILSSILFFLLSIILAHILDADSSSLCFSQSLEERIASCSIGLFAISCKALAHSDPSCLCFGGWGGGIVWLKQCSLAPSGPARSRRPWGALGETCEAQSIYAARLQEI